MMELLQRKIIKVHSSLKVRTFKQMGLKSLQFKSKLYKDEKKVYLTNIYPLFKEKSLKLYVTKMNLN